MRTAFYYLMKSRPFLIIFPLGYIIIIRIIMVCIKEFYNSQINNRNTYFYAQVRYNSSCTSVYYCALQIRNKSLYYHLYYMQILNTRSLPFFTIIFFFVLHYIIELVTQFIKMMIRTLVTNTIYYIFCDTIFNIANQYK